MLSSEITKGFIRKPVLLDITPGEMAERKWLYRVWQLPTLGYRRGQINTKTNEICKASHKIYIVFRSGLNKFYIFPLQLFEDHNRNWSAQNFYL